MRTCFFVVFLLLPYPALAEDFRSITAICEKGSGFLNRHSKMAVESPSPNTDDGFTLVVRKSGAKSVSAKMMGNAGDYPVKYLGIKNHVLHVLEDSDGEVVLTSISLTNHTYADSKHLNGKLEGSYFLSTQYQGKCALTVEQ